ncbi:hypothetical protein SODALDRAFT_36703 [Sodiomyces alkalinus F11]|uniref:Uncharacterized protein n=1 Tax=Sodiomyces alkalinus (strain CBS 110278 / VKM F-3762 / F11) TaxID=1314773 RepID=A0A3N2Q9C6_SODAK|nr:hypothetical protein SODALDRAFT_36703 [Sodiomyces alkalinus F11]ROT43336.1 hypothetical protein SODALDRAFT_36703 [Sodiomyces alkalinus F11]
MARRRSSIYYHIYRRLFLPAAYIMAFINTVRGIYNRPRYTRAYIIRRRSTLESWSFRHMKVHYCDKPKSASKLYSWYGECNAKSSPKCSCPREESSKDNKHNNCTRKPAMMSSGSRRYVPKCLKQPQFHDHTASLHSCLLPQSVWEGQFNV